MKNGEIINNSCPNCRHDLQLKQFRVWNTLFLVPLTPTRETRFVYECTGCDERFDPVYRSTFINRAKYLNATAAEIKDLTDEFSLIILSSVLTCDGRSLEDLIINLKDFAIKYRIDLGTHQEKFSTAFLTQQDCPDRHSNGLTFSGTYFITTTGTKRWCNV